MLIKSVILENFRGYRERQVINFSNLTAFVGRNDVGKSSILEALDIFFNDGSGAVKIDSNDANRQSCNENDVVDVIIGVTFYDFPDKIDLDAGNETSLRDEFLLDDDGSLTILKRFTTPSMKPKTYILSKFPANENCRDLLYKKQSELRKLTAGLDCDRNKNAEMRKAIRALYSEQLDLRVQEIDASKEEAKNIWEKIKIYMPVYTLFQSDRSNGDKDKEVQDPLKEAVKNIVNSEEIKSKCKEIYDSVISELKSVSERTLEKLHEINPEIAGSLNPTMPSSEDLKWTDVFSKVVSIAGDNDIPLNKRGSGVKRMVLLSFFRAEAEREQAEIKAHGIIYAIEEPETAQHIDHQLLLINSLKEISSRANSQVIITTHSSDIVKTVIHDDIRIIIDEGGTKKVSVPLAKHLPYVSLNEINHSVYNMIGVEYHNELYGYLQSRAVDEDVNNEREKDFDNWLVGKGQSKQKSWIKVQGGCSTVGSSRYTPNLYT